MFKTNDVRQLATYVLVGTACASTYLLLALMVRQFMKLTLLQANWIALPPAQILAYYLHKYQTFGAMEQDAGTWRRFATVAGLGIAVSTLTTLALEAAILSSVNVLAINCVVVPLLNFMLLKLWIFVPRR